MSAPGCICVSGDDPRYGCDAIREIGQPLRHEWRINPACPYHLAAAAAPDDHTIPWNCPTYWDGCNCAPHPSTPPTREDQQ